MVSQSRQARTAQVRSGTTQSVATNSASPVVPVVEQLKAKAAELGRAVNVIKAALSNGITWDKLSETCYQKKYTELHPLFAVLLEFSSPDMANVDMQVWRKTASLLDKTARQPITEASLADMVSRLEKLEGPAYMKPVLLDWMKSLSANDVSVAPLLPSVPVEKRTPLNALAKSGLLKPKATPTPVPAPAPVHTETAATAIPVIVGNEVDTSMLLDVLDDIAPPPLVVLPEDQPVVEVPAMDAVNVEVDLPVSSEVVTDRPEVEVLPSVASVPVVAVKVEQVEDVASEVNLDMLPVFDMSGAATIKTLHADPLFKLVPLSELLEEEILKFPEGSSVLHMIPHLTLLLEEHHAISGVDALCLFNTGHVAAAWVPFNAIAEVPNAAVVIQGSKLKHMLSGIDRSLALLRQLTSSITASYTLVDIQLALHTKVLERIKRHGLPEQLVRQLIEMADDAQRKFLGSAIPDISHIFALEQLNKQFGEAGLSEVECLVQAKSGLSAVRETAQAVQTNKSAG